jgi:hypothetical protein
MSDPAQGKAGVVRALLSGARAEYDAMKRAAEGEQIALFEPPTRLKGARAARFRQAVARRSAAGRPAGAQNLTTKEFRDWLFGRGVSPLVALMRYAILPPDLLAKELGCSKLEAFREWRILQTELAPFMHAKLAFVDDDGKPVPWLQFNVAGHNVTIASGMTPWQLRERLAEELKENQLVVDAVPIVSHGATSHAEAK